ncbi:MAG: hypothetical protein Q8K55_08605 [Gemmatimonadaceae bacterium]|nr:hypothetical protein [Gemmatimonadaceae bacterium]
MRALLSDAGVRASATARVVAIGGAPVILWLAATRLPNALQGYFFAGVNIVALAQLFELGLGTIIVQFASHEWSRLKRVPGGGLEGDAAARHAITVLLRSAVAWYGRAGGVLFAVAGVGGALLFDVGREGLSPVLWLGFSLLTAVYLTVIPFICVAEGCGALVSVQRMRGVQAAGMWVGLCIGLINGDPLLAVGLAAGAQFAVAAIWLVWRQQGILYAYLPRTAGAADPAAELSRRYRREQGRSARLWVALSLMFQSLAPILLYLRGGDAAGQLGITLAVALAPLTLSVAWLHGRFPTFGALVADGQTRAFDRLVQRATREAAAVFAGCAFCLACGVMLLPLAAPAFAARFLPISSLMALFAAGLGSLLLQAMAGWLRAFRDEEFATPVVTGATSVLIVSTAAAALGGVVLMPIAFAVAVTFIALPVAARHFLRVRRARLH